MRTHYGNQSYALDRTKLKYGQPLFDATTQYKKSIEVEADCVSCQMHRTLRLPLASNNKPHSMCVATCTPRLKQMLSKKSFLTDFTRAQLMVKYPKAGLSIHMDKASMIQAIEIYLLQVELFGEPKEGLSEFN